MNANANLIMSSSRRKASSGGRFAAAFDRWLLAAAACAFLLTALSWLAQVNWLPELLTHFRLQFAGGALLLLALSLWRRKAAPAVLAGLVAVVNGAWLVPYVMPGPAAAEASEPHVRLMSANVSYGNGDYAALREAVREEDPDIVGFLEVTEAWSRELAPLRDDYPFAIVRGEAGAYGLALFSRIPLAELPSSPYVEDGLQTAILVELLLQEKPVTLILSHVRAPTASTKAALRNRQLRWIAAEIGADGNDEQILVGDLNTTPWSPWYRELEESTGMVNAARGRGYASTWPAWLPTPLLRIPIDHCLLSEGLRVQQFRTGPDTGSDHLPIVADIVLAEAPPGEAG